MPPLLIVLQCVQVTILWLHDWVPLGRLNDVATLRATVTRRRLLSATAFQSLPYTLGLIASLVHAREPCPTWLRLWLALSYGMLFVGELRAWWWPYLVHPEPRRALLYRRLFGRTHAFLPRRHGIVPNTLHTILHASTAATLVMVGLLTTR